MISQILYLLAVLSYSYGCTTRGVTVTGTVACGDSKYNNVVIELREHDTFTPDDSLNKTKSDQNGSFKIYGEDCEIGNIEPYLRITHKCDNGVLNKHCTYTDDYPIPKEYVGKTYNMGLVSLNIIRSNHKKDCS